MRIEELSALDVLLIDGRSGAGKTRLADRAASLLQDEGIGAQMLRLEHLYPGWDGLEAGSLAVARALDTGRYRRYDWMAGAFAEEVLISARTPLIIEGCGAITRANLEAASRWAGPDANIHSVWISSASQVRKQLALERDGEVFAPHWEEWAAQERAHFNRHRPWTLATRCLIPPPSRERGQ